MHILPLTTVSDIETNGTDEQKAAAKYFDKNGNGIIEKTEADSFNSSKISKTNEALTITSADGYVDKYENISTNHTDSYYESGYIPVAVIDDFSMNEENVIQHGTYVCNIMKSTNPDISITKFNTNHTQNWNGVQKFFGNILANHPNLEKKLYSNDVTMKICEKFFRSPELCNKSLNNAISELKNKIDAGTKYEAANLSQGPACDYETINNLVSDELGVEITPDNIADYKKEIKEILKEKQNQKITYYETGGTETQIKAAEIIETIELIESLNIPVYLAGTYKTPDGEETFNLYSLADNALTVEAGVEDNGEIMRADTVSHNSFAIDGNGNRRLEDSTFYDGSDTMDYGSTSFATPMALANDMKEKYKN